jgi:UDP-GlcNAc:undecaprenyl-phosphate/decaprenyl-phosphate GlcNAc-1-phosphate transferase
VRTSPLRARGFPVIVNYRGNRVPAILGVCFGGGVILFLSVVLVGSWVVRGDITASRRPLLWISIGIGAVLGAGLYDDFRPHRTRGLVNQLMPAVRGKITSGLVKLVSIVGASAFVSWMLGVRGWRFALAVPFMAGCANLWNLLDVRPGRALKFFLPAEIALTIGTADVPYLGVVAAPAIIGATLSLVLDLLEWGMLGDSGSNVLGFIIGIGLLEALSLTGLAIALGMILALHVLAETVTLSRLIEVVPPVRWFDGLGRRRAPAPPAS